MSFNPQNMIEKLKESTKDLRERPTELFQDTGKAMSESIGNATRGVKNSLDEFSQKGVVDAGKEFLETNGFLAKFVFIIFVLIVFMVLLNIGMRIIGFFMKSSTNPLLVDGKIDGATVLSISQDPGNKDGKIIQRSNNKQGGAEYTWSTWLYMKDNQTVTDAATSSISKRKLIFTKGDGIPAPFVGSATNPVGYKTANSPGLYTYTDLSGFTSLEVIIDCVAKPEPEKILIKNIPHNKWFHLAIRLQNKIVDVYMNGVVSVRKELPSLPKHNYLNVSIGGMLGSISTLQYYSYAMNVFEINNIVIRGPNLNSSSLSTDGQNKSGTSSFLSNVWYKNAGR
jgi:hypothetical protein